jgi:hypothetical protein
MAQATFEMEQKWRREFRRKSFRWRKIVIPTRSQVPLMIYPHFYPSKSLIILSHQCFGRTGPAKTPAQVISRWGH